MDIKILLIEKLYSDDNEDIVELNIDNLRKKSDILEIDGTFVCKCDKKVAHLFIESIDKNGKVIENTPIDWNYPSPFMSYKYPNIPNAKNSKFIFSFTKRAFKYILYLKLQNKRVDLVKLEPIDNYLNNQLNISEYFCNDENYKKFEFVSFWKEKLSNIVYLRDDKDTLISLIYFNSKTLFDAKCAFIAMRELKELSNKLNDDNLFTNFWKEIKLILNDRTITQHGFQHSLKAKPSKGLWEQIGDIIDILKKEGYDSFIVSGTLLGYRRENGFIAHDDDADLAIILHSNEPEDILREWEKLRLRLIELGVIRDKTKDLHFQILNAYANIDLFPSWITDNKVYIYPHTSGELNPDAIYPLKKATIEDIEITIPNKIDDILEINYGKNWQKPDPTWSFDWDRAIHRFIYFHRNYKRIREELAGENSNYIRNI